MLNAIFDFNGTMFFDETFQEKAWQQYMTEKLGRRITPEEFQTWIHGRNTGDTLEYFFGRSFTQQEADEEEEAEETIYRALCRQSPDYKLADGLMEFLDFLVEHNIPRTIATASCGNNVRFFFDTLGLDRWFDLDKVVYNDGTLPGKPAPETCVIFEDSGAGIESAQRAGAKKVVGIASMKKPAELETLGVDAVIGDYTDLGKLAKILEV